MFPLFFYLMQFWILHVSWSKKSSEFSFSVFFFNFSQHTSLMYLSLWYFVFAFLSFLFLWFYQFSQMEEWLREFQVLGSILLKGEDEVAMKWASCAFAYANWHTRVHRHTCTHKNTYTDTCTDMHTVTDICTNTLIQTYTNMYKDTCRHTKA